MFKKRNLKEIGNKLQLEVCDMTDYSQLMLNSHTSPAAQHDNLSLPE